MIKNPILPGFNPDPSICRVGEDYYIATSTFEWFPGVQIHHSRDLVNWRLLGHALNETRLLDLKGVPSSGGVWAPALTHCDGLFYLCYTVVHQHEAATKDTPNYLITAPSVEGPWSDPVFVNSSGFDPSLFHDEDGRKYWLNMVWDHRPEKHPFYGIVLQEYDPQAKNLVGKPELIFKGSSIQLTEGPHLYKRNGYYYLLTAEGGTEYEHAVTLARSRALRGPYEVHPENPILTSLGNPDLALQKSGHASLVETPSGEWYMPHLCGRPIPGTRRCNLGRETAIQKVEWREDDWLYLSCGGNEPQAEVPAPDLEPHSFPELPSRLPFDSPHYATPRGPSSSVVRKPNRLTLEGKESLESNFEQAMLARRLTTQRSTVTTSLVSSPRASSKWPVWPPTTTPISFTTSISLWTRTKGFACKSIVATTAFPHSPSVRESFRYRRANSSSGQPLRTKTCNSTFPKTAKTSGRQAPFSMPPSFPTITASTGASPAPSWPLPART